jgi:hypothetical protein
MYSTDNIYLTDCMIFSNELKSVYADNFDYPQLSVGI